MTESFHRYLEGQWPRVKTLLLEHQTSCNNYILNLNNPAVSGRYNFMVKHLTFYIFGILGRRYEKLKRPLVLSLSLDPMEVTGSLGVCTMYSRVIEK